MCIIKILIDKGVRAWPQYRRRTHACTQIHMMTGGAAEMKGLRRKRGANSFYWSGISAISDAPQQKSHGRLRDLQPAPPTLSCICVWLHFHYWTAERIIGTTLSTLQDCTHPEWEGGWKNHSGPRTSSTLSLRYRLVDATELWAPELPDTGTVWNVPTPWVCGKKYIY